MSIYSGKVTGFLFSFFLVFLLDIVFVGFFEKKDIVYGFFFISGESDIEILLFRGKYCYRVLFGFVERYCFNF